ncbi:MAG: O-succinylbenzoate synthase, partial [Friedmanniella sp.]|nr:O-succinylbenzoate synthase [Friedmanniella sp.]
MSDTEAVPAPSTTYALPMRMRFRGLSTREGMVWRGDVGWAEWSPFLDYDGPELVPWWHAAQEAADVGWPAPRRLTVPVNATVPALDPTTAYALVQGSGCGTAKVKVAEPGQSLAEDLARVEAVRGALGPGGHLRVDANGGWSVDQAETALRQLDAFDLEYVEQPCRTVEELADLRRRLARSGRSVPIAADESIRRVEDPYRVVALEAADIAVLKVQPLGGVRACLEIAERIGLPVVVSSALETSVGIRAGLALAASLPELPYACGLNTVPLLGADLVPSPLVARAGVLTVDPGHPVEVDPGLLETHRADAATDARWRRRRDRTRALAAHA